MSCLNQIDVSRYTLNGARRLTRCNQQVPDGTGELSRKEPLARSVPTNEDTVSVALREPDFAPGKFLLLLREVVLEIADRLTRVRICVDLGLRRGEVGDHGRTTDGHRVSMPGPRSGRLLRNSCSASARCEPQENKGGTNGTAHARDAQGGMVEDGRRTTKLRRVRPDRNLLWNNAWPHIACSAWFGLACGLAADKSYQPTLRALNFERSPKWSLIEPITSLSPFNWSQPLPVAESISSLHSQVKTNHCFGG